jgi:osmotically-inducible protein OsmY
MTRGRRGEKVNHTVSGESNLKSHSIRTGLMGRVLPLVAVLAAGPMLEGCAPALIGAAVVTGASIAHDRRTTATQLEDQNIELQAMDIIWSDPELRDNSDISVVSFNQVLLVMGQAKNASLRDRFIGRATDIPKVRKVVNEITLGEPLDLQVKTHDIYISSKVELALFSVKLEGFDPTRVKVKVEDRVVFLMGLLTHGEADAVVEEVRYVPDVAKVVKVFEYLD